MTLAAKKKVMSDALSLPADARVDLVEKLLTSLNLPSRPEIDRAWAGEAERRLGEIERGDVTPVPGKEVFSRIRKYPRAWSKVSKNTRRCLVSRFPYGVMYKVRSDALLILAVAHLNRRPGYWHGRLVPGRSGHVPDR